MRSRRAQASQPIAVDKLIKCKMMENLEFLQWLKKYWDLCGAVLVAGLTRAATFQVATTTRAFTRPGAELTRTAWRDDEGRLSSRCTRQRRCGAWRRAGVSLSSSAASALLLRVGVR